MNGASWFGILLYARSCTTSGAGIGNEVETMKCVSSECSRQSQSSNPWVCRVSVAITRAMSWNIMQTARRTVVT